LKASSYIFILVRLSKLEPGTHTSVVFYRYEERKLLSIVNVVLSLGSL